MLRANFRKRFNSGNGKRLEIDVDLEIALGVTVLFGPSGSGKTTILRTVAGVTVPDEGRIVVNSHVYFDSDTGINMPIQERRVGYVFQNHALFPHLTAEQNALYGAKPGGGPAARDRVRALLSLLAIENTADRYPHELSGGEQQRIALARALASDPIIMLLDEPLSAVDAVTRSRLLGEIVELQRNSGIPFLYVTHSHTEAARVGDSMIVLLDGKVVQRGKPLEVINAPQCAPVVRAVGTENLMFGIVSGHKPEDGITTVTLEACKIEVSYNSLPLGSRVTIGIRSEDIIVARDHIIQTSARNVVRGLIRTIIRDTDRTELVVDCGVDLKVSITEATVKALELREGAIVYLLMKARSFYVLP